MDLNPHSDLAAPRLLFASARHELLAKINGVAKTAGWEVVLASNADETLLQLTAPDAPVALLLDTELPGIGTLQLLAATRGESTRKYPILLVSDKCGDEWNERLNQGDIDDILTPSAESAYWQLRIESAVRTRKMLAEIEQLRETALLHTQFDALTGAHNRETVMSLLFRETDRVQRMKGALCMILFDIDDFGHWNALFGKTACDALLCEVVTRTRRLLRSYDLLGRVGKDEFIVALPGCSGVNAVMLAERLRQEVFAQPYEVAAQNIRLTACFGISMSRGRSPVVVLREVELALQQARSGGPETIQFFSEEGLTLSALELPGAMPGESSW